MLVGGSLENIRILPDNDDEGTEIRGMVTHIVNDARSGDTSHIKPDPLPASSYALDSPVLCTYRRDCS